VLKVFIWVSVSSMFLS